KDSQASFQVSRDLYLKRADEHEDYKGYEAGIIVFNPQTKQIEEREGAFYMPRQGERLLGAYAIVYRQGMVPFKAKVSLDEYNQNRSLWNSKPATMIVKV
ncbi:MAG: phage recombination protein Bet, partial [Aliifodinibius sp.]|nr:recombinase RecT [Fodinibius sp.]NIY28599.1 phage recombination protein Bet [Fodinibius sp.]